MKKFLAIVMCAVLLLSCLMLSACDEQDVQDALSDALGDIIETGVPDETDENGDLKTLGGKTPEQLYADAYELLSKATNFTMTSKQNISMVIDGEPIDVVQNVFQKIDGDNSYFKTSGVEGAEMEGWYVDGVVYAQHAGEKVKATVSKEDYYKNFLGSDANETKIFNIPESWFVDIAIKQEGEEYYILFSVSGDEYSELIQNANFNASVAENVDYKVYFTKDGKILRMVTDFSINVDGVVATTHAESIFENVGTTEPITAPADADSYTDVTSNLPTT